MLGLEVRVVPGPNGPHGRGFVSGVGLGRVLKVGVRPARAIHADVARHTDVGTAVGLAHHGNHRNLMRRKKET